MNIAAKKSVPGSHIPMTPANAGLLALERERERLRTIIAPVAVDGAPPTPPENFAAATDGIAIEFDPMATPFERLITRQKVQDLLGKGWELRNEEFTLSGEEAAEPYIGVTALPPPRNTPSVGEAWRLSRNLLVRGVRSATPLIALVAPTMAQITPAEAALAATEVALPDPNQNREWHRAVLNIPKTGNFPTGKNVTVAVLDTGYTNHPEIKTRWIPGIDILDGKDPRDPMEGIPPFAFPGHGTAVGSVIASPAGRQMPTEKQSWVEGIAPDASVMPVRMTTNVILLSPNKLIPGIQEAIKDKADGAKGADVINISLGMPYYWPALRAAVRSAVDKGVIIVAASGNVWPFVVYPAAFPESVAAAACFPDRRPWPFSGAGDAVDVLAPGAQVNRAAAKRDGSEIKYSVEPGTGTTFAAACCSGLAALFLEKHGGRQSLIQHYNGEARRVPQAFHYLIRKTAVRDPSLPANQYGVGIPDATALLNAPLPTADELDADSQQRQLALAESYEIVGSPLYGLAPATSETGRNLFAGDIVRDRLATLLHGEAGPEDALLIQEVRFHIASRKKVFPLLRDFLSGGRPDGLRDNLLSSPYISDALRMRLAGPLTVNETALPTGDEAMALPTPTVAATTPPTSPVTPPTNPPQWLRFSQSVPRKLRVYAADPSLSATLETADYKEVTVTLPDEPLKEGPVGRYIEVIDVDPASGLVYEPVDLDERSVVAMNGLDPNEDCPQFHQQMVYAVAMKTVGAFERALGRPVFWATKPYKDAYGKWRPEPFVERLRIHPHALRERNAYYSPEKRALLFGYFSSPDENGSGRITKVNTCLSYDIIAHETTHAILDGIYPRYTEPTNPDMLAFHEALADIVALFQHFSHPEVLRASVEENNGDLERESLLGKLAVQFGRATGRRGALRDAIGAVDSNGEWKRNQADATLLRKPEYRISPHRRGSILVAAVFDSFLRIYRKHAKEINRLVTGQDNPPPGRLRPEHAAALSKEAAKVAQQVLTICIRALDYMPPVDATFGDYLRALITADRDLVPNDPYRYRTAFAQSFRAWGIHPEGVAGDEPDSLCWEKTDDPRPEFTLPVEVCEQLNRMLTNWRSTRERKFLHDETVKLKGRVHKLLEECLEDMKKKNKEASIRNQLGIDLSRRFEVHTLRPMVYRGPDCEELPMVVMTLTQKDRTSGETDSSDSSGAYRAGSTVLFNLGDGTVRYVIPKSAPQGARRDEIAEFQKLRLEDALETDTYHAETSAGEPFAALHLTGRG